MSSKTGSRSDKGDIKVDGDKLYQKGNRSVSPLRDNRYLDILCRKPISSHHRRSPPRRERHRRSVTPPQRRLRGPANPRSPRPSHRSPHRSPRRRYSSSLDRRVPNDYGRRHYHSSRRSPSPSRKMSRCLGVFGISCHTSSKDLRRHFAKCGTIKDAQVVSSRGSGFSSGFGYVLYYNVEDAAKAKKKMNNTFIDGMKLKIEYSNALSDHSDSKTVAHELEIANKYCFGNSNNFGNSNDYLCPPTLPSVNPHPAAYPVPVHGSYMHPQNLSYSQPAFINTALGTVHSHGSTFGGPPIMMSVLPNMCNFPLQQQQQSVYRQFG